jgi:23S rRNA-/tRNA-specific pseudouridylate synthase
VQVRQRSGGFILASAFPRTGYTHQVRAHLAAVDLPILADPLYKSLQPDTRLKAEARKKAAGLPIRRLALHALQITFLHPHTGLLLTIEAPYPEDFGQTVQQLF